MSAPQQHPNSDQQEPQRQPWKAMTVALFVMLALWVASIALGSVLFSEEFNWRKPIFLLAPMLVFLTLWAVLLAGKSRRENRP